MRRLWIVALLLPVACISGCRPGAGVTAEPTQNHVVPATTPESPTLRPTGVDTITATPGPSQEPTRTRIPPTATLEARTMTPQEDEAMTPAPAPSEEPTDQGLLLRMVYIRARSSREVQQLRQMPLVDVIRVRPDPRRPPSEETLSGGFIVEAVATQGILAKLKAMGFEVSEIPPEQPTPK